MRSLARFVPHNAAVRWLLAALVVVVVGLVGLSAVFSDLGPGETLAARVLWNSAVFVAGGVLTTVLSIPLRTAARRTPAPLETHALVAGEAVVDRSSIR